jgi:hypothetical protein
LLESGGVLHRFLKFELNVRGDGSLYISFQLSGDSPGDIFIAGNRLEIERNTPVRSGVDLSYHTTGMVNPKNYGRGPIYCQPLYEITDEQHLITISIPTIDRLDRFEKDPSGAAIIVVPKDERLTLAVVIAPFEFVSWQAEPSLEVECGGLFRIGIIPQPNPLVQEGFDLSRHLIFVSPSEGPYRTIRARRDEAFVRFHQRLTGAKDISIYGPNGNGEYLLVPSVPMREAPKIILGFENPDYRAFIVNSTNHSIKYKVFNKKDQLIKEPVSVISLALDARL